MILQVSVNIWAVLVCALLNMPLGMIWFSRPLFGTAWLAFLQSRIGNQSVRANQFMGLYYFLAFLGSFLLSYVMAHVMAAFNAQTFTEGLQGGFWMWLGFAAPLLLNSVLWENKPWKIYYISLGHLLVYFLLISGILAVWR